MKSIGITLLGGALVVGPALFGCGGGEEEAPRPVASAAPSGGGGTYWGGGSGGGGGPSIGGGGGAGMRVGGGGGPVTDAMIRRRREREAEMRRRLGPVRLTDEGTELWPLYEDAVRRMEREVAGEDDPCEASITAGEIFAEDVGGERLEVSERARSSRCRAFDEELARCLEPEYREAHEEECEPHFRRAERARRELNTETPDMEAVERAMADGREAARRAGMTGARDGEPAEAAVLPDLNIPSRGDGVSPN